MRGGGAPRRAPGAPEFKSCRALRGERVGADWLQGGLVMTRRVHRYSLFALGALFALMLPLLVACGGENTSATQAPVAGTTPPAGATTAATAAATSAPAGQATTAATRAPSPATAGGPAAS